LNSQNLEPAISDVTGRDEEATLLRAVAGFVLVWLLLWTVLPLLGGAAIPSDNLEELKWAAHLEWGYAKHPPLPTWIIYAFARVFPATVPMTYALGALQVAMMLYAAWLIGRKLLGPREACVAVLLITCITFYTNRMHFFNHNTALLVATAGAVHCLWNAVQTNRLRWWLGVGACWGIGMLSKYQMVVTIACNLAYLGTQRPANVVATMRRLMLAGAVGIALCVPHLLWVFTHGSPTVHYALKYVEAEQSLGARLSRMLSFNADQLARLVPALALLFAWRRPPRPESSLAGALDYSGRRARVRLFLAIHAWGPLVIMNSLGLLIGLQLGMHWGTAYLWLLPLWYVATPSGQKLVQVPASLQLTGTTLIQGLMVLVFLLTV
jgi:4-amino-4-deoxy-L-arabinose transferase-like glycosyltransferase